MKQCPQCDTGYPDSHATCPTHGVLLNEIRDLKPGMLIHKTYRIVRKLGQGGMGSVYLAQHIFMEEPRALKFLSAELSQDEAFTGRFRREVRTLRQLRHNNVVDCGDLEPAEDDSLFFPMEFVDGPDLRRFLHDPRLHSADEISTEGGGGFNPRIQPEESGRALAPDALYQGTASAGPPIHKIEARPSGPAGSLPVPLALSITRGIAEGLGAAHAKGMVHRDIKAENILMAREGGAWVPKIADFGIVATKESSDVFTRTGGTLLTMTYAAPEQWRGTPAAELDGRTDLYALGGLLYEMLTGQTPFHSESYEGWSRQHQTTPPPPPSALRPDLANWKGLDALVLRLLAKDREDRPKDVAQLLGLIDAVRSEHPTPHPVTIVESHPKSIVTPSRSEIMKWALAAILIVIALGIWAVVRISHSTAPASTEGIQTAPQPASASPPTATKPSKPVSTFPTSAPGGGMNPVVPSGMIPSPISNAATLLVTCDLACNWTLDGEVKGRIEAGGSAKANIMLGQHIMSAATLDGLDKVGNEIEIKTITQTIMRLQLQPVRDVRLKAEQEARDKAAQEARDKAAQEQAARDEAARLQDLRDHTGERFAKGQELYKQMRYKEARPLFEKACDGGKALSCFFLAGFSEYGVPMDSAQTRVLYKKACDGGFMQGCSNLGLLYDNGQGVSKDFAQARALFQKACDGGLMGGCNNLGLLYDNGQGVSKDFAQARTLYQKACYSGDMGGCGNLGMLYEHGHGVSQDYVQARTLYQKACDGGVMRGCTNLGRFYAMGQGVKQDYSQARILHQKACDGGEMFGCNNLGVLYQNGQGVRKDYFQARVLFQKACDGGDMMGCTNLGELYQNGQGVSKDSFKARMLYQKACDGEEMFGCTNLGVLYQNGQGVSQDYAMARTLYQKACNGGDEQACENLSNLH